MSDDRLKRRTYGYKGREIERPVHTHREVKIPRPKVKRNINWLKIILLPVYFVFWIIGLLIKGWKLIPKTARKTFRAKIGWLILVCVVFGFLFMTVMVAWVSRDLPDPDKLTDRKVAQSTKIYDRTGEHILYEVFADQKRTIVELDQVPKNLVNGVIATEDAQFYLHSGIQWKSFVRAIVYGIFTSKRISGTSTLTQQLVKNAILTTERSYVRKLKEIILSIRLEQKYSKDQILKIFFNEIPYGSTNYGVESASQSYFGKHVSDLNLAESSTLAGLPQAPSKFLNDMAALKQRRDFVLRRMFEEGYITEQEKTSAQAEPLTLSRSFGDIKAPHFVLYVKEKLVEMFGEQAVDTGGLKVITTLDWNKQEIAEKSVRDAEERLKEGQADNASLVALDPKTGQILAMVGSRDFYNEDIKGQFNVATLGKRQPGSSFKPIIYAAAFEKGYTPDTILFDVKTNFAVSGNVYEPQNYDLKDRGPVTMRQALQGSLNIPAVQTLYLVGAKKGVEFAGKMGYSTLSEGEFGLSLVLGGGEVKLIDHVNAYGIFANSGIKYNVESILQVDDSIGEKLYQWKSKNGENVLSEKITATISNVLSDDASRAYVFGAGGVLTLPGRPVAVKTGTTNNYRDAWTVGYTPSLVAGVWVGNTNNKEMKKGDGGSKMAAPIWNQFMRESLKDTAVEEFPPLPENDTTKPILRGSNGGGITLEIDKVNGKIATSSTPPGYIIERTYVPGHSVLHYVIKDDPRGPAPADPSEDPQYFIWEKAIQDWVTRKKETNPDWNVSFEEPPTEYDDVDGLISAPSLDVFSPTPSSTLNSRQIDVSVRAVAPRGITKVTYKIDDKYIGVIKKYPFDLSYYYYDLQNGVHVLSVVAEDDLGNRADQIIPFILQATVESPAIYWSDKDLKVGQTDFPKTLLLGHYKLSEISELKVYVEKDGNKNLLSTINNFSNLFDNQIMFKWVENPGVGGCTLISEVKLRSGDVRESGRLAVSVE